MEDGLVSFDVGDVFNGDARLVMMKLELSWSCQGGVWGTCWRVTT